MNTTLFENWVFADILKLRSYCIRLGPKSHGVLIRRQCGDRHAGKAASDGGEGGGLGDAAASQGCTKTDTTNQAGRDRKEASLKLQSLTFSAQGTGFVKDNFSIHRRGDNSGSNIGDGEEWKGQMKLCLLSHLLLICCATQFQTSCRPGFGDPCPRAFRRE